MHHDEIDHAEHLAVDAMIEEERDAELADARALWAVRVLDAWKKSHTDREWRMQCDCVCAIFDEHSLKARMRYPADSEDAARLAAAEAVFPELPADVRAELGERP